MQNPNHQQDCDCQKCELWLNRHEIIQQEQVVSYNLQYMANNRIWEKQAKIEFRNNVKSWYKINRENGMTRRAALDNAYFCAID